MRAFQKDIARLLLPAFLVIFVLTLDFRFFAFEWMESLIQRPKAFLLIPMIIFVYWSYSRIRWFRQQQLIQKFQFIFIVQIIIFAVFLVLDRGLQGPSSPESGFSFIRSIAHIVQTACFSLVFLSIVGVLIALKDLIFIKQGKRTRLFFILLLAVIGIKLLAVAFDAEAWMLDQKFFESGSDFSRFVMICFCAIAAINAFRCKWIHYLNRRQKIRIFFAGLVLLPVVGFNLRSANNMITEYHAVLGAFIWTVLCFYMIYISVGLFTILMHLPSSGIMDRRIREIQSLQSLISTLGSLFSLEELTPKTMELTSTIFNGDFAWMETGEGPDRRLLGTRNITPEAINKLPIESLTSIRIRLKEKDKAILINDLAKEPSTRSIRRWEKKAGSLLAARLELKDRTLGYLYVIKEEIFGFAEEDHALFQAFADQVAISMENCRLVRVTIEQETYHEELRLAHQAQMRLLPQRLPKVPGVDLAGFCMTANEIGGDFYDVIPGEDRVDFVIGDVAGKGASAAFHMAELKGMVRSLALSGSSPKDIVLRMNDLIYGNLEPGMFTTVLYGVLIPSKRRFKLVRAGHPPAVMIRNHQDTSIEMRGTGLGMIPTVRLAEILDEKTLTLQSGDTIFFYTDGLIEALDPEGNEFGETGLSEFLKENDTAGAETLLGTMRDRVTGFMRGAPRHDDLTAVVFRIENSDRKINHKERGS